MTYQYQSPIKMPRGSHYGSDYWISYSYKLKRKVRLFSMLEYSNFIELEMNSEVEFFCEQPLKIEKLISGNKQTTVFDFYVYYKNGTSEFQEIKYSSLLSGTEDDAIRSQKQIDFQRFWCEKNHINYKVVTELDLLKSRFRSNNLQLLQKHLLRSNNITDSISNIIINVLSESNLTINELKQIELFKEINILDILSHMYYEGKVSINLDNRPLDDNTEVMLCEIKNSTY